MLLQGDPSGAFIITCQPPREAHFDYWINRARESDEFPSWRDETANGFPSVNTYTITGLDVDVCYKIRLRARYNGSADDWAEAKGKISGAC